MPCCNSSWPGRIDKKESSSGAPRKIEGMKSRKEWVIAIETMKIAREIGEVIFSSVGEIERRKTATRFTWMPGNRPVNVPARIPRRRAIANSIIIVLLDNLFELSLYDYGLCFNYIILDRRN